jgi:hypothetical protein
MTKSILVLTFFVLLITSAQAQIFRFRYESAEITDAAFRSAVDTELTKIQNDLNKDLPANSNMDRFMVGMANSSVYSGKGVATDYVTDFSVFTVGLGVGVGADMEKDPTTASDFSGVGFQGALQFGLNMGILPVEKVGKIEMERLNVMFNMMKYDYEDATAGINNAGVKSFGVMASYKWKDGKGTRAAGWGGVKLHTGYQFNSIDFNFTKSINEPVSVSAGAGTINTTLTANPSAGLEVATHSIPLEISTDVRFLYILSLYGGLGVDYSWGEAKAKVNSNANSISVNCGAAVCGGGSNTDGNANTIAIQPEGNLTGTGKADAFGSRAFLGLQVNVPFVRIYVQGNKNLSNEMVSGAAGLRLAF